MRSSIENILQKGKFLGNVKGRSMYPMLRSGIDTIVVECYKGKLKKYDVPLYKKNGKYILHRVIRVLPDSYVMRGDNCFQEEYGILESQILGILTGFYRKNRYISVENRIYKSYVRVWCLLYPLRKCIRITEGL